jgi:hypothetical protein
MSYRPKALRVGSVGSAVRMVGAHGFEPWTFWV